MNWRDYLLLTSGALTSQKMRSALSSLGIAIGVAAVVLLTSIGSGVHRFVLDEFTQFGTTLIAINPGKAKTFGASIGVFGSVRPLSIDDVQALRRLPYVKQSVGFIQGNAQVKGNGRQRRTNVYGTSPGFPEAFTFEIALGGFLPDDDPRAPRALAVLGSKLKSELFGNANPLGARIRIGGDRYRVIGVMRAKGNVLGFDLDDTVYIPLARALDLFNRDSLMEVDVLYEPEAPVDEVVAGIRRLLSARHGGEDVTITTQDQMLEVLGSILEILTFAVGALGSISLVVGGVGIFAIMTISVGERTSEIGLLQTLGARRGQIMGLFLGEAMVLAAVGGLGGLLISAIILVPVMLFVPALPVHPPAGFIVLALLVAMAVGIVAGVIPARGAAHMEPVDALQTE